MKQKIILILLFSFAVKGFACLSTIQYKTFPIGTIGNEIITIDAYISRSGYVDRSEKNEFALPKTMWSITSYISVYNENQVLISTELIKNGEIINEKYLSLLKKMYIKGIELVKSKYKKIEYFSPEYISFGDFQKKCEKLELKNDKLNKTDFLVYNGKKYPISLKTLKGYENYKKSMLFSDNLASYLISSVRIYKTKRIELIIGHIETGHEISMGWITDNPNKKPKNENDIVICAKEHKPEFDFNKLENAVYEEPLLHHGYGFDFFIVNKTE